MRPGCRTSSTESLGTRGGAPAQHGSSLAEHLQEAPLAGRSGHVLPPQWLRCSTASMPQLVSLPSGHGRQAGPSWAAGCVGANVLENVQTTPGSNSARELPSANRALRNSPLPRGRCCPPPGRVPKGSLGPCLWALRSNPKLEAGIWTLQSLCSSPATQPPAPPLSAWCPGGAGRLQCQSITSLQRA